MAWNEEESEYINLRATRRDEHLHFRIKKTERLERLFRFYSEVKRLFNLRFLYDGERLSLRDTPEGRGIKDNDEIQVFEEQGGSWSFSDKNFLERLPDPLLLEPEMKMTPVTSLGQLSPVLVFVVK